MARPLKTVVCKLTSVLELRISRQWSHSESFRTIVSMGFTETQAFVCCSNRWSYKQRRNDNHRTPCQATEIVLRQPRTGCWFRQTSLTVISLLSLLLLNVFNSYNEPVFHRSFVISELFDPLQHPLVSQHLNAYLALRDSGLLHETVLVCLSHPFNSLLVRLFA